jgi:bleomycin hydrolase
MKDNKRTIDIDRLRKETSLRHDNALSDVMKNAIIANGIEAVAFNNTSRIELQNNFSHEIKTGKITSQEKSGRCWMFAGLNLFRPQVIKKLNVEDFEFSQNYLMFFDKLEKANYFLESILRTIDEEIYSRIIMWILDDPLQDGGQWDMFVNLVNKYGAIPKNVMPETFHSNNSALMNQLLTSKLRQWAEELRNMYASGVKMEELREFKTTCIQEFYHILTYFLGDPPVNFDFEYKDQEGTFHRVKAITPLRFYTEYVGIDLNDYYSLIHAPTPDKPFGKTYTIDFLGNVVEGKTIIYLNAPLDAMKKCTINQLKNGEPVWFGCDIRWQTERKKGLMDTRLFLFDHSLSTTSSLDKTGRLLYGESVLTHAMVFTGVNLSNEKPTRWKVENSWGEERGEKGYFIMSDSWFDEFNYQVVINKKYLTSELLGQLKQEPIVLPPWDPMGSLAG